MSIPVGLAKLERAAQLLAEVRTLGDAKTVASLAAGAEAFAREMKLGRGAEQDAASIRIRAERKMGEILATSEKAKAGRPSVIGRAARPIPTLEDLGISKDQSARAQKLAKIPEEQFRQRLATAREESDRLTTSVVLGAKAKKTSPSMQDRRTPRWFYDFLNAKFGPFKLDAFAEPHNALCAHFYTREDNGLVKPWSDVTFGNPEFDDMAPIIEQALRQAELGRRSVILGPVGCAQAWFHELAIRGTVYKPSRRISYDLPDGTSTDPRTGSASGADRDTDVFVFGGAYTNGYANGGFFKVERLVLPELAA